ncbi:hypothetical protein BJX99DRAFT_252857 [Aspergillus californicus]
MFAVQVAIDVSNSGPQHLPAAEAHPKYTERALEICREQWLHVQAASGKEDERALCIAFKIALTLFDGKRYKQAMGWYRFVYLTELEILGGRHLKVLEVRDKIADVLNAMGRHEDASRWQPDRVGGCTVVK